MERERYRAVMTVLVCCEGTQLKGETLALPVELWVMTIISQIQAAEMSFLHRVAGRFLRDRVRSSVIWEEFRVEPLLLPHRE